VQTRRAKALAGFRTAPPLHEKKKETPGEAPGIEIIFDACEKRACTGIRMYSYVLTCT
jgi:hypothetical protein